MNDKRAVVTGGAGFIGSHISDALVAEGYNVLIVDDLSSGKRVNVPSEARLFEGDICGAETAAEIIKFQPHVVSHHAAQIDVRKSVSDPAFDAQVNIGGLCNIVESARQGGALEHVLFASSGGAMYGEQEVYPAPENHPVCPESPYGLGKWVGERYLDWFHRTYGFNYTAMRYGNVYGPRQNPHGEAGVIAIFCDRLLAGQDITIFGDGLQTRDYVYVHDVVQANMRVLENGLNGAYNVGTGIETDVLTLAQLLQEEMKPHLPKIGAVQMGPHRPGEQQRSVIDAALLKAHTGFSPETLFAEGLAVTASFFRAQKGMS